MSLDRAPLFRLRLRTPRLELRLPTTPELEDLRKVASAGVHPPEFMPFGVPWTDDLSTFLDYHEMRRREWSPESWHLELGVWLDAEPIGVQAVHGEEFAATLKSRRARGSAGTSRAAASARRCERRCSSSRSGASARKSPRPAQSTGNEASLRVSEKLGYRIVGRSTVAPRGVEVGHADLELRREDWQPPFPVELHGVEPCLALFGVA